MIKSMASDEQANTKQYADCSCSFDIHPFLSYAIVDKASIYPHAPLLYHRDGRYENRRTRTGRKWEGGLNG